MRGARVAFLGVAGLAVLAGLAYAVWLRAAGGGPLAGVFGADGRGGKAHGLALRGVILDGDVPVRGATILVTSDEDGDSFSAARCPNEEDRSIFDCPCAAVPDLAGWRIADGRGEAALVAHATTSDDGTFLVTGLAPGRYAVWAEAGDLVAMTYDVEAGERVELALAPAVWYGGVVRDEEGVPVEDAQVAAVHRAHSRFFQARTDEDGGFLVGPLPEGPYAIFAWSEGRIPDVDLSPSGDMELKLAAAARVEGRVERDGTPVPGAEVRAEVACSPTVTTTDAEGRFVLERLLPARTAVAAFSGDEGGLATVDLTAEDREGLVIALAPGGAVAGEVRDDAGAPVAGVRVALEAELVAMAAVTDDEGRFRLSGLPADAYAVWLFPPPGFVRPGPRAIRVEQGGEVRASYRLLRAARIAGVVEDEDGVPIADAVITGRRIRDRGPLPADWDARGAVETRSDRAGAFALEHAAAGAWRLSVAADGFVPATFDAQAPEELAVTLLRGGALDVEVVDESGAPVPGALLSAVALQPPGGEPFRKEAAADASGWHRFDGLPPGRYRVVAQRLARAKDGVGYFRTVTAEETVEGPVTTALRLRFELGMSIAGKVVEEGTGRPLAGVEVAAVDEVREAAIGPSDGPPSRAGGLAITDAEGRFEIPHLRPRRHRLSWALEDHAAAEGGRWARPMETGLVLTMRRTAQLTGRVTGHDGSPLDDFTVSGRPFRAAGGTFALPIQRAGPQTLRVEADGHEPLVKEITLDDRRDRDVGELRLSRGRTVRISVLVAATAQPVRSAEVQVGTAAPHRPWAITALHARGRTGRDGTVALGGLPATPLDVLVVADGLAPALVPLGGGATDLAVRLDAGGRIEGIVRNAADEPVRNVPVTAAGAFSRESLTDRDGRFTVEGLPPGDYSVALEDGVTDGNAGLSQRPAAVKAGGTARVEFRESTGATLALRVPPPEDCGAWLVPGAVTAGGAADLLQVRQRILTPASHEDRVLLYRGLAPGPYTAACVADATAPGETARVVSLRRIDVAGSDVEVTLPAPTVAVHEARAAEK
ncbi:MAG TPA: carboxypeptidase regulatory-like domain-containing protein [Anaeromyxobacter sp.]|nr:carboxypeptidase regulatory-like domain-containing protein [Anaeromyxobacter sp.]